MLSSKTPLSVLLIAGATMAADFSFAYGATGFLAWKAAFGVDIAKNAYSTCIEKTNDGSLKSTGALCVYHCTSYVFGAAASVTTTGYGVSLAEDGIGAVKEKQGKTPPTERSVTNPEQLLNVFNNDMSTLHGQDGLRGDAIVASAIHSNDGYAVRLNVRNDDDSSLHLHTNGTHATAMFHPDDETSTLARRQTYLDTQNHYYTWSGLDGLKVEWHNINHDPNGKADFSTIMDRWARSDLQPSPILSNADVWDFQACNKAKTATFFYGRLIFEKNRPRFNYENISPRGCNK